MINTDPPPIEPDRATAENEPGRPENAPSPCDHSPGMPAATPPSVSQPPLMRTIGGRYELRKMIGSGGMGETWTAFDTVLLRAVVVKLISATVAPLANPAPVNAATRLKQEAEVTAQVNHPNIVAVYDSGADTGHPYYVMEYLEGETLDQRLRGASDGHLDGRKVASYLSQAALGIAAAHANGLVHRDLKPSNLMVITKDGADVVKVLDFGLVKRTDLHLSLTAADAVPGTPGFISPEQINKTALDHRSDVYSLGVTLYYLITGKMPFEGATPNEIFARVLNQKPLGPRHLVKEIAHDLETICLKCLDKDPGRRYASAKALADDLGRFLNGQSVWARRASLWERGWLWCRRRPALATIAALLLITLAVGGPIWGWRENSQKKAIAYLSEQLRGAKNRAELNLLAARQALNDKYLWMDQGRYELLPPFDADIQKSSLEADLKLYSVLLEGNPGDPQVRQHTARAYGRMGNMHRLLGRFDDSERANLTALDLQTQLLKEDPASLDYKKEETLTHGRLGVLYSNLSGRAMDAEHQYRTELDGWQRLVDDHPDETRFREELTNCQINLGVFLRQARQPQAALKILSSARSYWDKRCHKEPENAELKALLAAVHHNLGSVHLDLGDLNQAVIAGEEGLKLRKEVVAAIPDNHLYELHRVQSLILVALLNVRQKKIATAEDNYGVALRRLKFLMLASPKALDYKLVHGVCCLDYGNFARGQNRIDDATSLYDQAASSLEDVRRRQPQHKLANEFLLKVYRGMSKCHIVRKDRRGAVSVWGRLLERNPEFPSNDRQLYLAYTHAVVQEYRIAVQTLPPDDARFAIVSIADGRYDQACVYALAAAAALQDNSRRFYEPWLLYERYARAAVRLLRDGLDQGLRDVSRVERDPDFTRLRDREDFKQLVRDVQARQNR